MPHHSLSPAYGRDHTSGKQAVADFNAGKDFIHNCRGICEPSGGMYASCRDFPPGTSVQIRYRQQRQVAVVTVR